MRATSSSPASPEGLLRRLEWTVLRRLDGLLQGDYRSLFRGFGLDLADIREYEYGDDVRFIDWNVTARLGTPYVRRFDEDREITAWFLLDLSPSVDFGSVGRRKLENLVDFVAILARVLTRQGNKVGALLYDGLREELVPARGGRDQVLLLIRHLMDRQGLEASPPTDLGQLFASALEALKRRSLVFVVSDFQSAPGWTKALSYLCARHDVLVVRLSDPAEEELPVFGSGLVRDAETGEELWVDSHDRRLRERFAALARRHENELREGLARAGVDTLELSTLDELAPSILRFAELRKARATLAGGGRAALALGRRT